MSVRTLLLIAATWSLLAGWWKIPSTESELRNPLAPYRALAGTLHVLIGLVLCLVYWGSL